MKIVLPLAAATLALTACGGVPKYRLPVTGGPTAQLEAVHSPTRVMSTVSTYALFDNPDCQGDAAGWGRLPEMTFATAKSRTATLPVGGRIFVYATDWGSDTMQSQSCANVVSFTPEAGRSYRAEQRGDASGCVLDLRDAEAGRAPLALQRHEVGEACYGYLLPDYRAEQR